jgi:hypothetical protein
LKYITAVFLIVALFSTFVAIPLLTFTPQIYGRPNTTLGDLNFIRDYIISWWQKTIRRYFFGEIGPAENVTVNTETSHQQSLSKVKATDNPQTAAEIIKYVQKNSAKFSYQILNYLQTNDIPNKSAQIDVLIVPENLYVTFAWDGATLTVYDGWQTDLGSSEWIEVILTSNVVVDLWNNRENVDAVKGIILNAEKNGELSYTLRRINPITSETIQWMDLAASTATIIGWTVVISPKFLKRTKEL